MLFGALGDIHGDFASLHAVMRQNPDIPFWVCVGDVATDAGEYEAVEAPLFWIKGNNEDFDRIARGDFPANLQYIANGHVTDPGGVRVAGLGGTFAPSWYETAAGDLPHPEKSTSKATELADKRRHFVREEVERCKGLRGIDLLLTHEAARPYRVGKGIDAGKTPINEVLAGMQPRLHLFGHHHRFSEQERQGVRSVGLDIVSRSYLRIDGNTLEYHVVWS